MPGVERGGQIQFQSAISSQAQPWWRGVGENAPKSSSSNRLNGGSGSVMIGATDNEELADGVDYSKQTQHLVSPLLSGTGRDVAKDCQSIKHVLSETQLSNGKQPDTNSQMELLSCPIVLTSYPYPDAQYGGILTAYAQQAMIHPQLYGMHARMPLPLEMKEEPVYVNAKQYHGILRRRQSRAKAELEKKVLKVRKPYLHESRHLHAMRRARGCGGRFLNMKKLEGNDSNAQEKGNDTGTSANPSKISGSSAAVEHLFTNNENLGSSNGRLDAPDSAVQHMRKVQSFPIGSHDGNCLPSIRHSQLNGGDCLAQERQCLHRHGAPNGAVK